MAKALSHTMSTIRGSVAGLTYSANQFAQIYMKARSAPVQPNTLAQTYVRQALNYASIAWQQLTQADRDAWEDYADTVTYLGPQGSYKIPGRQIMIAGFSLAQYLNAIGAAIVGPDPAPPVIPGRFVLGGIEAAAGPNPGTGFGITINNYGDSKGFALIDVSPPQNLTRQRYKGPWDNNKLTHVALPATTSTTKTIDGLVEGMVYFARIRCVTDDGSHRLSSETFLRFVADTLP